MKKKHEREKKKRTIKRQRGERRLNQLHPKEFFICIRICTEPEQMPAAFVSGYF